MNFVCRNCNNKFSNLETELYQKSIIAIERSVEGIEGYKPNKAKPAPLKASLLLVPDEIEDIVYEGGQFHKFQVYLRPQIIEVNGLFYLEGNLNEDINSFIRLILKWRKSSSNAVLGAKIQRGLVNEYFQFSKDDEEYRTKVIHETIKVRNEVRIDLLQKSHDLYESLSPRLFLDDRDVKNKRLRVRARNVEEAKDFLEKFLGFTSVKREFDSFPKKNLNNSTISVGLNWDEAKLERALAKIGLNCLMHYFPESKSNDAIKPILEYVRFGKPGIKAALDKRNNLIDTNPGTHNLFFYQMPKLFSIRISLFDGKFVFHILIPNLILFPIAEYKRLVVDYQRRANGLENQAEFLTSFDPKTLPNRVDGREH